MPLGCLWTPCNRGDPGRGKGGLDRDGFGTYTFRRRCLGTRFGFRATGRWRPADLQLFFRGLQSRPLRGATRGSIRRFAC